MKVKKRKPAGRRGGGFLKTLFNNPVAPVLIGMIIVLAVGFWAMRGEDVPASTEEKPSQGAPVSDAGAGTAPAPAQTTPAPKAETPAKTEPTTTEPAKTEPSTSALAAERAKIDRSAGAAKSMLVTVYYSDGLSNGMSLQPVEIKVPHSVSRIKVTAEQVINAPHNLQLYSNVPAGTTVTANLKDGVATVDLSAKVLDVRGAAAVNNIMASFVYSLTSIPDVKAVQLWVNGKPALLDGYEWSKPLTRADVEARNLYKVEPVIKYSGS